MRLSLINENSDLLSNQANFETKLIYEPEFKDMSKDEIFNVFTEQFTTNPPPGISPINAKVIDVDLENVDEDGLVRVIFKTSIGEFIKNSIEYDIDPYDILGAIKKSTGNNQMIMSAANNYMRNNKFKVAKIGIGNDDEIIHKADDIDISKQF